MYNAFYSIATIDTDMDVHANSQAEGKEAVVAEIGELMTKMERLYEWKYRAKRQAQAVTKRSTSESKRELLNENVRAVSL